MMLSEYVRPEMVFLDVCAETRDGLLEFLLDAMENSEVYFAQEPGVRASMREAVLARERYGSTDLGRGVIFPHARVSGFNGILLALAICRNPVAAGAVDDEPVSIACLAVVPAERPTLALKVASGIAKVFGNPEAREFVRRATDPLQATAYLAEHDLPIQNIVLARDVAHPYPWTAGPDTPIREIARQMLQMYAPAVAVLDDGGRLLGEVSLTRLFRFGLPDFFRQLKSVAFVRNFDPFEQYFLGEARASAKDLLNEDVACVPEDGTLMEIVHALAVRRRALVHVRRGERAVGYVDGAVVLNQVLSP